MPDITQLLGQEPASDEEEDDEKTSPKSKQIQDTAPIPGGDNPDGGDISNVMGEHPHNKYDIKRKDSKIANTEDSKKLLDEMMYSPNAGDADGTVSLKKPKTIDKPQTEALLEILTKGTGKIADKYKKALLEKAMKDPTSVEVKTKKGWMTVKDAIGDGFDLTTNDFTNKPIPKVDWKGAISKLDPREQENIKRLTTPGTRQAGPAPSPDAGIAGMMGEGEAPAMEGPGPAGEGTGELPPAAQGQEVNHVGAMGDIGLGGK